MIHRSGVIGVDLRFLKFSAPNSTDFHLKSTISCPFFRPATNSWSRSRAERYNRARRERYYRCPGTTAHWRSGSAAHPVLPVTSKAVLPLGIPLSRSTPPPSCFASRRRQTCTVADRLRHAPPPAPARPHSDRALHRPSASLPHQANHATNARNSEDHRRRHPASASSSPSTNSRSGTTAVGVTGTTGIAALPLGAERYYRWSGTTAQIERHYRKSSYFDRFRPVLRFLYSFDCFDYSFDPHIRH